MQIIKLNKISLNFNVQTNFQFPKFVSIIIFFIRLLKFATPEHKSYNSTEIPLKIRLNDNLIKSRGLLLVL